MIDDSHLQASVYLVSLLSEILGSMNSAPVIATPSLERAVPAVRTKDC